jgi:hypothetical protein
MLGSLRGIRHECRELAASEMNARLQFRRETAGFDYREAGRREGCGVGFGPC